MNLLIIGAGYVGMPLIQHLHQLGYTLSITTRNTTKFKELSRYTDNIVHLPSTNGLQEAIARCDGMIVLVAPQTRSEYENTYLGTSRTISSMLKALHKKIYLIYTSSSSVYEGTDQEWVTEDLILNPTDRNANILLQTEHEFLQNANTCILRLGGIYGPERELLKRARILSGKEMPSCPRAPTNHIHLTDIILGISHSLNNGLQGIYNLVNDSHPTKESLYNALCQETNLPPPIWKGTDQSSYKVCNAKIKKTGFLFQHAQLK